MDKMGFSLEQPNPIVEFGVSATIGLSIGVVITVLLSGLSKLGLLSASMGPVGALFAPRSLGTASYRFRRRL